MKIEQNFFLYPEKIKQFNNLVCGFTLPSLGNMALTRPSYFSGTSTEENRLNLSKLLNIPINRFFSPLQIHTDKIIIVDENNAGRGSLSKDNAIEGDSCISFINNILLMISFADCVPILMYEPESNIVCAIHSGWKSTKLNIVSKTINILKKYSIDPNKILCCIGPSISDCCYNVGDEFYDYFKNYSNCFKKKNNLLYFNLPKVVYKQLIESGINSDNIEYLNICTSCSNSPKLFSNRRDGINFEAQGAFIGIFNLKK